nr:reverse transcriptase domain-containing protein [Tanacetum cinerariifolium]
MTPRNHPIVFSGVKSSLGWLPVRESATQSPIPFEVIHGLAVQPSPSKPGHVEYCKITSQLCHSKNSHRGMRRAFQTKDGGDKSDVTWIILANNALGHRGRNQKMRFLSNSLPGPKITKNPHDFNNGPMFALQTEAKPLARTIGKDVKKFVWDNIVCRFGLPKIIVTNNGTNFVNDLFKSWCKKLNIQHMNTNVAHPQANDLVERANRSLMEGLKHVLKGKDLDGLTYGSEVVIPAKVGMPTHRIMMTKEGKGSDEKHRLNLDPLQEIMEASAIREAKYKAKMKQYYNKRVRPISFKVGEYVYRKNKASRVENLGKLGLTWEGPYQIVEAY